MTFCKPHNSSRLTGEHRVSENDQGLRSSARNALERTLELIRSPDVNHVEPHSKLASGSFKRAKNGCHADIALVREDGDSRRPGHYFPNELQMLSGQLGREPGHSGDSTARVAADPPAKMTSGFRPTNSAASAGS